MVLGVETRRDYGEDDEYVGKTMNIYVISDACTSTSGQAVGPIIRNIHTYSNTIVELNNYVGFKKL